MCAACPTHLMLLYLIIIIISGEDYKICSSSLCNLLQPPVASTLLGPNILRSTLFSNTLNLCYSPNVRDQVSHPYKTTGKITILYILMFTYLNRRQKYISQMKRIRFPHESRDDILKKNTTRFLSVVPVLPTRRRHVGTPCWVGNTLEV
jgi:hypothetical protein